MYINAGDGDFNNSINKTITQWTTKSILQLLWKITTIFIIINFVHNLHTFIEAYWCYKDLKYSAVN